MSITPLLSSHQNNWLKSSCLFLGVVLLSSCANLKNPDAPIAENFPRTQQKELQAAQHWKIIAEDIATQIQQNQAHLNKNKQPIYINMQTSGTHFSIAFKDFLLTSLTQVGVPVSKSSRASKNYDIKIHAIQYKSNRSTILPSQAKYTTLAAGLVVIRNVAKWLNTDGTLVGIGAAVDTWDANNAPKLEVIITTSLVENNIYLARSSDVYYANDDDMHLYEHNKPRKRASVFDDPFYQSN